MESAHGKLSEVDQKWDGPRYLVLTVITLAVALTIIYVCASVKHGDFRWNGFLSHDFAKHTFESSNL
jgi:hypothetical protein